MSRQKPTKMWLDWERTQYDLTIEELEATMKIYKRKSRTRAGYWTDAKWHLWTTILRDKKLEKILGK